MLCIAYKYDNHAGEDGKYKLQNQAISEKFIFYKQRNLFVIMREIHCRAIWNYLWNVEELARGCSGIQATNGRTQIRLRAAHDDYDDNDDDDDYGDNDDDDDDDNDENDDDHHPQPRARPGRLRPAPPR